MPMIECKKLDGTTKMVHKKDLILRPSAYAIIMRDANILLLRLRHTGKYHLPGGGVHIGERIKDTLKREVGEETGLEIEVGTFTHFEEIFFYFDPSEKAYHGLFFYYICFPKSSHLIEDDQVDDFAAEKPRWVEIASLHPSDFQINGDAILEICNKAVNA